MTASHAIMNKARAFPGTIAISGAAGRFGNLLIRRLHRTDDVVSIDPRDFNRRPADVAHFKTELRRRECRNVFRTGNIRAVIQLGPYHSQERRQESSRFATAIENFSRLLDYCDKYAVEKLVLLSSANVYGARPSNPQFLTEEAPLLASDLSALRDVDMMAQSFFWKRPDIETVILRPAHVTGGVGGVMARYLRTSPVMRLMGFDPMIQLIHEEDLVQAIRLALGPGHRGVFNLAGPPPLPLSRIIERLGRKSLPVPHFMANRLLGPLRRLGRTNLDPAYVDYLRYVCMVEDSRARTDFGYSPACGTEETIAAVDIWE